MPATVCRSACNIRRRKWIESTENCNEKIVKSHQENLFLANLNYLEPLCAAATHKQSQKPWDDAHGFWVSFALYFGWVYLPIFTRDRSNFDISADTTTRWFTMTKVCVIFATVEDVVRLDFGVFQAAANIGQFDEILTQWKINQLALWWLCPSGPFVYLTQKAALSF
jgi:hypothetical protein